MSADALTVGCKRNVKPEMAELEGKRLIIAAELEEGMRLNTSTVKQLCSTDEIPADRMVQNACSRNEEVLKDAYRQAVNDFEKAQK